MPFLEYSVGSIQLAVERIIAELGDAAFLNPNLDRNLNRFVVERALLPDSGHGKVDQVYDYD